MNTRFGSFVIAILLATASTAQAIEPQATPGSYNVPGDAEAVWAGEDGDAPTSDQIEAAKRCDAGYDPVVRGTNKKLSPDKQKSLDSRRVTPFLSRDGKGAWGYAANQQDTLGYAGVYCTPRGKRLAEQAAVDQRVTDANGRIDGLSGRIDAQDGRINGLSQRVGVLEADNTATQALANAARAQTSADQANSNALGAQASANNAFALANEALAAANARRAFFTVNAGFQASSLGLGGGAGIGFVWRAGGKCLLGLDGTIGAGSGFTVPTTLLAASARAYALCHATRRFSTGPLFQGSIGWLPAGTDHWTATANLGLAVDLANPDPAKQGIQLLGYGGAGIGGDGRRGLVLQGVGGGGMGFLIRL